MSSKLIKQSALFRKCASWFQDNGTMYRNRGFNAPAGQGLWEDINGLLYKLSMVKDVARGDIYVLLQVGKPNNEPARAMVRNVIGLKTFITKYHKGQKKLNELSR